MVKNWALFGLALLCTVVLAGVALAADAAGGGGPLQKFVDAVNNPATKTGLLLVGGFVLKLWPQYVNKSIPIALTVLSTLLQVVHTAFPDTAAVQPAAYVAAAFSTSSGWGAFLFGTLAPVLFAVGINSGQKNLAEWSKVGFAVMDATGQSGKGLPSR